MRFVPILALAVTGGVALDDQTIVAHSDAIPESKQFRADSSALIEGIKKSLKQISSFEETHKELWAGDHAPGSLIQAEGKNEKHPSSANLDMLKAKFENSMGQLRRDRERLVQAASAIKAKISLVQEQARQKSIAEKAKDGEKAKNLTGEQVAPSFVQTGSQSSTSPSPAAKEDIQQYISKATGFVENLKSLAAGIRSTVQDWASSHDSEHSSSSSSGSSASSDKANPQASYSEARKLLGKANTILSHIKQHDHKELFETLGLENNGSEHEAKELEESTRTLEAESAIGDETIAEASFLQTGASSELPPRLKLAEKAPPKLYGDAAMDEIRIKLREMAEKLHVLNFKV